MFSGDKFYYEVQIKTGSQEKAGANELGYYITLVGSKGSSGKIDIDSQICGALQRGEEDKIFVECNGELGEILVVVLGNTLSWLPIKEKWPWYVEFVKVYNYQSKCRNKFPCYHWIGPGDHISFTAHTGK